MVFKTLEETLRPKVMYSYLDESLKAYEYVYPACGNAASAVKLLISELEVASNYIEWVDICK